MAKQLKITVLKRDLYKDLIAEYAQDKDKVRLCPLFTDGQEFIMESPNIPEKFCSWAWADIHRDCIAIFNGADYPGIKQKGTIISCCTDGLRPVVFKIERIGE